MKNISKLFRVPPQLVHWFIGLLIYWFIVPSPVYAADLNVDCPSVPGACTKTGLDPLLSTSLDGQWVPGKTVTKTINLKNSSSSTQDLEIQGMRVSSVNALEDILTVSIMPTGGGPVIWAGTVAQFYAADNILMGNFASGASLDYDITVSMDQSADNSYQSLETIFDLMAGFWGVITPTPTPTSTSGGGGGGGGGTGGGEVLGDGVTTSVCSDATPGGAPTLTSVIFGNNSATLTWTPAASPVTYYLVAYGTSPGSYTYGNPNVGNSGTRSYTVSNLSGGTTYYFVVRAGNGCMPGAFSNERSATPGGGFVAGPAAGFSEGVLGVRTEEEGTEEALGIPSASPTSSLSLGSIAGSTSTCSDPWWKMLVPIGAAVFLFAVAYFLSKEQKTVWLLLVLLGSAVPGVIVLLLFCEKIPWLIGIIVIALASYFFHSFREASKEQ